MELKKAIKGFKKGEINSIEYISDYLGLERCIITKKPITYPNTIVRVSKNGEIKLHGSNAKTFKVVNGTKYYLKVSYQGMVEKFGSEYLNKNISRVFNTLNKFSSFAFQIPKGEMVIANKKSAITLKNQIEKYGKEEGTKRYYAYCEKQSKKNTFEYKKNKFGWTEEQFNNFNKKRAVTLENQIEKYGQIEGTRRYDAYCEKQSKTSTSEYILDKYGLERLKEINHAKGKTLNYFKDKYGDIEGHKKYLSYWENSKILNYCASKVSIEFFNIILCEIENIDFEYYYGNNEYGIFDKESERYFKYDFTIPALKLIIEFNGDNFHANPKIFKINDCPNPFNNKVTSKEIWDYDFIKKDCAKRERDFDVIYIWESDVKENNLREVNKVLNEIRNRRNRKY